MDADVRMRDGGIQDILGVDHACIQICSLIFFGNSYT